MVIKKNVMTWKDVTDILNEKLNLQYNIQNGFLLYNYTKVKQWSHLVSLLEEGKIIPYC